MSFRHIPLLDTEWTSGSHPLERKIAATGDPVVLLEFAPGFADPTWCERGHFGLVLAGNLGFEFTSTREEIGPGDAFAIDPGTPHRAYAAGTSRVRVFLISTPGPG